MANAASPNHSGTCACGSRGETRRTSPGLLEGGRTTRRSDWTLVNADNGTLCHLTHEWDDEQERFVTTCHRTGRRTGRQS